jgi:solute carrier family 32 (vesicular inhibitory amino acid transporter)
LLTAKLCFRSKFGLNTQPLTTTIDVFLGLDTPSFASPEHLAAKPGRLSISRHGMKRALAILQRICITLLSVAVSILIPEFSSMMAFLGSFSAFMLAVVGPVLANIMLVGRCSFMDGFIVFLGAAMAVWGTAAAFYSAT